MYYSIVKWMKAYERVAAVYIVLFLRFWVTPGIYMHNILIQPDLFASRSPSKMRQFVMYGQYSVQYQFAQDANNIFIFQKSELEYPPFNDVTYIANYLRVPVYPLLCKR